MAERSQIFYKRMYLCVHTTVNNHGYIIHKTNHKKGRRHDYNIYKNSHPLTPKQVVVSVFDLRYMSAEKNFSDQMPSLPHKKKRNRELSKEEKDVNKSHSKKRG